MDHTLNLDAADPYTGVVDNGPSQIMIRMLMRDELTHR